jgi:hypothetical protein
MLSLAFVRHSNDVAAARAAAHQQYEQLLRDVREHPEAFPPGFDPKTEDLFQDPRFVLVEQAPGLLTGTGIALCVLAFVLGVSFVGAEWHHHTIGQLLNWESRRVRVLGAKFAIAAGSAGLCGFLFEFLAIGGLWGIALMHGTTADADRAFLMKLLEQAGRVSVAVALAALAGTILASLTRSTAAALGLGFSYGAVFERFLATIRPRWTLWLIGDNANALLAGHSNVLTRSPPGPVGSVVAFKPLVLTAGRATLLLFVYAAIGVALALMAFRHRDVT